LTEIKENSLVESLSRRVDLNPQFQSTRRCWKCGKVGHYKKDCKSKAMEVSTGSDEKQSTERKMTPDKGGDVYLASTST
jgi:hypothetical protein